MARRATDRSSVVGALALAVLALSATVPGAQQLRFDDVVRNLRNPDPGARMRALQMLRESKHAEAILPIAPLVTDPVDEIQLAAIDAELSFYLVDDVSPRKRVAWIVEVRSSGRAEAAFDAGPLAVWPREVPSELAGGLLTAVDDANQKVRIGAMYTLGAIARAPLAPEHAAGVIKALDHYDPAIRRAAARVAGRLEVKSAGEALITAMNDSQEPVRFAAMRALGDLREPAAVTALTEQLEHYRKGEGAWSALDALARIAHPSSVAVFRGRLGDRDAFMRRAAAEGLGRVRATADVPALETLAGTDSSEMVRLAATFALQVLGRNNVPRLANALHRDSTTAQVVGYFLELGQPVVRELLPHAKDPSAPVRANVALVLGAIGGASGIPTLQSLLQDPDRGVARAAERAIERIKLQPAPAQRGG